MQKVTFVEPRSPDRHIFSRTKLPLLGPIYLATILKEKGYDTTILNDNFTQVYDENSGQLHEDILDADVLALTSLTPTVQRGYEIAHAFKKQTGKRVIMGGFHATFSPQEALEHVDSVVIGPADSVIENAIHSKERIIQGNAMCDMDTLPMPDFSLVKDFEITKTTPITTSRGCPYNCSFCAVTKMFGQKYLFRSEEKVMEEIRRVKSKNIFFYDDHFAANKERTKSLMRRMIDEGIDKRWFAQVRADVTNDQEMMDLMGNSGCKMVYIGYESINPETLKAYNKCQSVETLKKSVKSFHDQGTHVHGMFIFGSDTDDKKALQATADFAKEKDIDTIQYLALTPVPGTPTFDHLMEENRFLTLDWKYFDGQHVVFKPKRMSAYELQCMIIDSMDDFYSKYTATKRIFKDSVVFGFNNAMKWYNRKKKSLPRIKADLYKFYGSNAIRKWRKYNTGYMRALAQDKLQDYIEQKERMKQAMKERFLKKDITTADKL